MIGIRRMACCSLRDLKVHVHSFCKRHSSSQAAHAAWVRIIQIIQVHSKSSRFYHGPLIHHINHYARPALPIWIRCPDHLSSLRSTGQLVPSALTSVSSSLVPSTRNDDFSGSIAAKS